MTILALDIGRVRTGVAASDPDHRIASPVKVVKTDQLLGGSAEFNRIITDYPDISLLVGLPVSMDGQEHGQAAWVRTVAEEVAERYSLPLAYCDERRSTVQAEAILRETGHNSRSMRSRIDMVAASVFLQSYLDGLHREDKVV